MPSPHAGTATSSAPCSGWRRGRCWARSDPRRGLHGRRAHPARVAALACTYVGAALSGLTGQGLHPSHFAERHGLVVIIALGEAFISIGIGATGVGIGLGEVVAAILGLSLPPRSGSRTSTSSRSAASGYRPSLQGAERARPRRVLVRAFPDDRGHRALRVRDEGHRRARRRGPRLGAAASRSAAGGSTAAVLEGGGCGSRRWERPSRGRFVAAHSCFLLLPLGGVGPSGARCARARHRRLAGVAHVRACVVARGPQSTRARRAQLLLITAARRSNSSVRPTGRGAAGSITGLDRAHTVHKAAQVDGDGPASRPETELARVFISTPTPPPPLPPPFFPPPPRAPPPPPPPPQHKTTPPPPPNTQHQTHPNPTQPPPPPKPPNPVRR